MKRSKKLKVFVVIDESVYQTENDIFVKVF